MSIKPSTVAQLIQAIEAELARMKDELGRAKGPRKAELKKLIGEGKRALEKLKRHLQFDAVSFGRHVHAVTEYIVAINDDVAYIDTDTEGDALVLGHGGAALGHRRLRLNDTAHGIDDTGKFQQQTIASGLKDAAAAAAPSVRQVWPLLGTLSPKSKDRRRKPGWATT